MKIDADKKFLKDFRQIQDNKIRNKIEKLILQIKDADSIFEIPNIKKLADHDEFYRIKFDYNYRIGLSFKDGMIILMRVSSREGFYKIFP